MLEKFVFWFTEHRKKIGYTLGALNVLGGLASLSSGHTGNALIQIFAGSVLIYDAWMMP
jgi:hypothetical protein